jgi:ATP-dependent protease ClpP protease subunit
MKKFFALIIAVILLFCGVSWCADAPTIPAVKAVIVPCPKTTMASDCFECHIRGNFLVKETTPDAYLVYPVDFMRLFVDDGKVIGYFLLSDVNSESINKFFDYLWLHNVKKAIIEIHSPGGGLFDAQRIVGIMRYWQARGILVETRLFGAAFSAAFYIFVAGDVRLVDEYSDLMWHEIQSFEGFGFRISTPSDKEEAAKVLRHLQDVRNEYLATRGKLSKAEIDEKIKKREFWMSGKDAVKMGFATGLITKKIK